jgi:hypothetical protein
MREREKERARVRAGSVYYTPNPSLAMKIYNLRLEKRIRWTEKRVDDCLLRFLPARLRGEERMGRHRLLLGALLRSVAKDPRVLEGLFQTHPLGGIVLEKLRSVVRETRRHDLTSSRVTDGG